MHFVGVAVVVCVKLMVTEGANWAAKHLGSYLHVTPQDNSPIHHARSRITVSYRCEEGHQVAVWLTTSSAMRANRTAFHTCWSCDANTDVKFTHVVYKLPKEIAFRPSHLNPEAEFVDRAVLVAAIVQFPDCAQVPRQYTKVSRRKTVVKSIDNVKIALPYERSLQRASQCLDWLEQLAQDKPFSPQCPWEPEVYEAIRFPVALSGGRFGVFRLLPPFTHPTVQRKHKAHLHSPQFTFSLWLYVVEYCVSSSPLCSIVHSVTSDDVYVSPLILFNHDGHLHLQLASRNPRGPQAAFLTNFPVVRHQWCHLVVSYAKHTWEVTMLYGPGWSQSKYSRLHLKKSYRPYLNDTEHLTVFGGSEVIPAFKGYIGKATVYRSKRLTADEISAPSLHHPMFELELSLRDTRCTNYLNWVRHQIESGRQSLQERKRRDTCPDVYVAVIEPHSSGTQPPQCSVYDSAKFRGYRPVSRWIRQTALQGGDVSLTAVGDHLYNNATLTLEELGLRDVTSAVSMLKQASCCGNQDATFLLSVLLNYGLGVKVHEIKAHSYLMECALQGSRLCQLSLANKHEFGLDGVPWDPELAYVYLKSVAGKTKEDREEHRNSDLETEQVRLTDEWSLQQQTDEDGDLFNWVRHQAKQGVTSAQKELARMLHWGSHGVARNLREAAELYRLGAQGDDPVANYDYGVVLLRGQGTTQNFSKALHHLDKSAAKGHVQALTAIGWHALEMEGNASKAVYYFEKAYKRGSPEAAHNLGHIYYNGLYPGKPADRVGAFDFFSFAARRGQLDSAEMIAMINMRGHPNATRDTGLAVGWARFVAEHNPALARVLAKGLKAYRHHDWETAFLYYLMAASTGVEVANFNLAFLCEENTDGLTTLMQKECVWRHYNLSIGAPQVDAYAWIKMGDYYWYGCGGDRNALRAAHMYAAAAAARDPHATFNLAMLVEEGVVIPDSIWRQLKLPRRALRNNVTVLTELYTRCKAAHATEAFVACSVALLRVQLLDAWARYDTLLKVSSVMGTATLAAVSLSTLYGYLKSVRPRVNTL